MRNGLEQVAQAETVDELKLIYQGAGEAGILLLMVDGNNLNAAIAKRKAELEAN